MQGPASAPITLVEYADFQCPYCGQAYSVVKELQQRLGDRVRSVFRNFPLRDTHPAAEGAAEAVEAAGAQGKFWEMHDTLFEHQNALDMTHLRRYGSELGLDMEQFDRDLSQHTYRGEVPEELESGIRSGVEGTPTFFINGRLYTDSYDPDSLLGVLERIVPE
jgi:protein-disulfide isomerase